MDVFPPAALCFHLAPPSLSAGAGGGWRRLGSGSLPGTPLAPERLGSLPRCTPSPFQLHLWRAASPHGIIRDARDLHRPSLFHLRISCLTLRRFDFYSKIYLYLLKYPPRPASTSFAPFSSSHFLLDPAASPFLFLATLAACLSPAERLPPVFGYFRVIARSARISLRDHVRHCWPSTRLSSPLRPGQPCQTTKIDLQDVQ
jgi:hypothetical protein